MYNFLERPPRCCASLFSVSDDLIVSEDRTKPNVRLITRTVSSWSAAKRELSYFPDNWIFRGHQESSWELRCNLDRKRGGVEAVDAERHVKTEFESRAHLYLGSNREPLSLMEWLALIQHHGGPTRLMDFTRAPMVAAFFALDEGGVDEQCAVWALSEDTCQARAAKRLASIAPGQGHLQPQSEIGAAVEDLLLKSPQRFLAPVQPSRLNARMVLQQGVFLCFGDPGSDLFANLSPVIEGEDDLTIVKLVFPREDRGRGLAELRRSNITREALFPGLDGLARSLDHLLVTRASMREASLSDPGRPQGWPGPVPS